MRDSRTTISLIADKDWMRTRVVGQPDEVFRYARECTGQNGSEHQANALSRRQRAEFCCRADILVRRGEIPTLQSYAMSPLTGEA